LLGTESRGASEVSALQVSAAKVCAAQDGPLEVCAAQVGPSHIRFDEHGVLKLGIV
jgi:hypothetical protein